MLPKNWTGVIGCLPEEGKRNGSECGLWQDLKWYTCAPEYYPDVDFMDEFLDEADEDEFYLVRIGEDYEDNEIRRNWWDNPFGMYLSRSIALAY